MIPLLFAAAVTLSPVAAQPTQGYTPRFAQAPRAGRYTADALAACAGLANLTVAPDGVPFRKLNELPSGAFEHAVWRTVGGCPMREVVYKGQTYYVGPSIPRLVTGPAVDDHMARKITPAPDAPDGAGGR